MKTPSSSPAGMVFPAFCLMALLGVIRGQSTTILHNFGDGTTLPNNLPASEDATSPATTLIQGRDGNFYGTTFRGGTNGNGTAFVMTPLGVVTILHNFGDGSVGSDGLHPAAALIQGGTGDTNFYGTTSGGGANGMGAAFSMTPEGAVTILHSFGDNTVLDTQGNPATDGVSPAVALVLGRDGNFYGTTAGGGTNTTGTAFSMTPQGVVTILHNFGDGSVGNDGLNPSPALIQGAGADTNFYGTTPGGGANNAGMAFAMTPQGTVTILHSFGAGAAHLDGTTATDGTSPSAGLIEGPDGNFYGTTTDGGDNNAGTAFEMSPQGAVTILHSFGGAMDGTFPAAGLSLGNDGNFYGTTSGGGAGNDGTAFAVSASGVETILHNFGDGTAINPNGNADGMTPTASLIQATDGNFYGATTGGGAGATLDSSLSPDGAIFKVAVATSSLIGSQNLLGNKGSPVACLVNASNSPTSYIAINLPAGLSLDATKGIITGTPSIAGTGNAIITITNVAGSNIVYLPFTITDYIFSIGVPFQVALNPAPASGGATPGYWTISAASLPNGLTFDPSTGTLSGTPATAGSFSFTVTAYADSTQTTALATQNYSIIFPEPFSHWMTSHPIAPLSDGVPNLLKYLCDIDPSAPMAAADRAALPAAGATTIDGTTYLTLTYRQSAMETGVMVQIQTSSDLLNWQAASPSGPVQQVGTDPNTGDPIMEMGIQANGSGKQFIRLNVTTP